MSKLNAGLYSSDDHTWQTPPEVVEAILAFERRERFDLDAATTHCNIPAWFHYTEKGLRLAQVLLSQTCGLTGSWHIVPGALVYLNPPYGNIIRKWIQKAFEESQKGCRVWALLPCRTETVYQHDFGLTKAGFTVFLKGRLEFLQNGKRKGTAPFPTMLLYYGDDWQEKARRWEEEQPLKGTLMLRASQLLEKKAFTE